MLEKFQSVPALRGQLESGYRYFFACTDAGERIGFLAFYPRGNELYLSKFYLQKDWRGKGLAWEMLRFVLESARALGLGAVELNVNRDNDAARAYERMGFVRVREEKERHRRRLLHGRLCLPLRPVKGAKNRRCTGEVPPAQRRFFARNYLRTAARRSAALTGCFVSSSTRRKFMPR